MGIRNYNDRPGLVSSATCPGPRRTAGSTIYCTPLGTFDASGATGKLLPINSETGPNHFVMNLRLTKTIGFGPKVEGTPRRPGGGPGGGVAEARWSAVRCSAVAGFSLIQFGSALQPAWA